MLAGTGIEPLSLLDYPSIPEIEEDGSTFLENALKKAKTVADSTGETALADDSGIEIDFLGGRPGIYSARYSGPGATDEKNNCKVLAELKGVPLEKRTAAFRCVLVLYGPDGKYQVFEGSWKGLIGFEPRGTLGFGYDPIFIDPQLQKTAAELVPEIKNRVSHRAQAFIKLKDGLSVRGRQ
jgi:XTP/dITP diphosphohydrolase